ncbi:signal transduction histidine kinase [Nocardioides ginsengisegetis]|uniref:Signal transduction histidine kinase n=1 Tax=Nocardioides ginsengisegetis TaxID=661491 RepID=A0A7W3P9G0_9ACTN|nr:histidine kinase [Nocardioides ginsengisegetis]MBA8803414.1 signal transduction histidine kinase [Nocardioides ginsengisegetis]
MRYLRSPVTVFLVVGVLTFVAIVLGTQNLAARAATDEAIAEATRTTPLLGQFVQRLRIPRSLINLKPGAIDRFDKVARQRVRGVEGFDTLSVRRGDGSVIYSTNARLIGLGEPLDDDRRATLASARTSFQLRESEHLVETYTRIRAADGTPLLLEVSYPLTDVESRSQEIFSSFRLVTIGPLALLVIIVTLMLSLLTRQLTRAGHERERLLQVAIDASDAERRRIARDLHDGVVQDLAGTAFSISALEREPGTPHEARSTLATAGSSLRDGLKALRSLLAEIHPPDLHPEGLAAALADLTAPAATADIAASVSVEGAEFASVPQTAALWRVAQEAVRNAIRHSQASTLAVTVRGDARRVALEVVDDGVGFDVDAPREEGHFGLRGLRSLVRDSGGRMEVRSSPGEGTTVHMEVDVR